MNTVSHDSETLAQGQQVFTAAGFIVREVEGEWRVFLPKRAETKKFMPGVYELPGGHVDFGEDMVVGLKREIKEEFGMEIRVGDPFFVFDYLNEVKQSHSIEVVYFAQFVGDVERIQLDAADHSEYIWANEAEAIEAYVSNKGEDDAELPAVRRGFELLEGGELNLC